MYFFSTNTLLFALLLKCLICAASVKVSAGFSQQNSTNRESSFPRIVTEKNYTNFNGIFQRVYFLYLYGATADDIESMAPLQSVIDTETRVNSPFLSPIQGAMSMEPYNAYWKRVNINGDTTNQFQRLTNILTGAQLDQLGYDIQMVDPLSFLKDSDNNLSQDSIIDQILSLKDTNSTPISTTRSQSFLSFKSNGKRIQLQKKFYMESLDSKLNKHESIKKLRKHSVKVVNDTQSIDDILELMTNGKEDIIIAYDDTLAKIKMLFDESSTQVVNTYSKINTLLDEVMQSIDSHTLLIVMGEDINVNQLSTENSEIKKQLALGESFLFAYSKEGFAKRDFLEEIEENEERKKLIVLDEQEKAEQSENEYSNEQGQDFKLTKKQQQITNSQMYSQPQIYIEDNRIASTLSLAIGLQIPTLNNGRNILSIYPYDLNTNNSTEQLRLFKNLFESNYKILSQQINLFQSLGDDYDFFSSDSLNIINQKYYQIAQKKHKVSILLSQFSEINKDIASFNSQLNLQKDKMTKEGLNKLNENHQVLTQQKQEIEALLKGHLAAIVDLEEQIQKLLSGKKSITFSLVLAYILFYIITFIFTLRQLLKQMDNIFNNQKEKIKQITKQLSIILPLTVMGYFIFSFYSAKKMNDSIVFICIAVSTGIFFLEVFFFRQKIDAAKLILIISVLFVTFDQIKSGGIATAGFFAHIILRLRYGTSYKNYSDKKQFTLAILIFFVSAFRLVNFDINSPFIDTIQILLAFKNEQIRFTDKLCFMALIITQYLYNFTYNVDDEIGSYLIYGCPIFILVLIISLYETIAVQLSFNKFFITNIVFSYFLNILINLRQPPTFADQFICCSIFYLPSYFIIILSENTSNIPFRSCIIQFVQSKSQIQKEQQQIEERIQSRKINKLIHNTIISNKTNNVQNDIESCKQQIQSQNLHLVEPQKQYQQKYIEKQQDCSNYQIENQLNIINSSINNHCCFNVKNFGIYTLTGVLQLIIILISFSQIFSDQYLLNPTYISHSKNGLIQYSIFQYLIAVICILISSQLKKSKPIQINQTINNYQQRSTNLNQSEPQTSFQNKEQQFIQSPNNPQQIVNQ